MLDLPLAPPHNTWDPLTQSWLVPLDTLTVSACAGCAATAVVSQAPAHKLTPPGPPQPMAAEPPAITPQHPEEDTSSPSEAVPMTPEALEASSIALAWRLQQEEQAAFYQAINANTPANLSPGARAAAATPEMAPAPMASLAEAVSPEDASLQLALRLQQEELRWSQMQSRQAYLAAMGEDAMGGFDESMDYDAQ